MHFDKESVSWTGRRASQTRSAESVLQRQPQRQQQQRPPQQRPQSRLKKQQPTPQQTPRSRLKQALHDSKQTALETPISQENRSTRVHSLSTRPGANTSNTGSVPKLSRRRDRKVEQEEEENVCPLHHPSMGGQQLSGSGFPVCTCKQRPTWLELFFGKATDKKKESEDSKGLHLGDSYTSIEGLQRGNWSEMSLTASRKLRNMLSKFHSTEEISRHTDVVAPKAQFCRFMGTTLAIIIGMALVVYFMWQVDHEVVVITRNGRYAGRAVVQGQAHVHEFLGVDFAREPAQQLRFHRPVPSEPHTDLRKSLTMRPACVQERDAAMDDIVGDAEDCLHLNIWTPMLPTQCKEACEPRAVVLFLAGRDFQHGGNAHTLYNGQLLSVYGDLVVVVPNYRLGALGFFNGKIVQVEGNAGLYDQKLAFEWILDNIEVFGGDPKNIALVGHDGGAVSLGHHLFSTERHAVQSAKRFLLHTSSVLRRYPDNTKRALENALKLGLVTSCHPDDGMYAVVECLQKLPPPLLKKAARQVHPLVPLFVPSYGKSSLLTDPAKLENGSRAREWLEGKQFVLSNVADEGSFEYKMFVQKLRDVKQARQVGVFLNVTTEILNFFRLLFLPQDMEIIINEYRKNFKNVAFVEEELWKQIIGDMLFYCPMRYLADVLVAHGAKVYTFVLEKGPTFKGGVTAQRYDDLHFMFGTALRSDENNDEEVKQLTVTYISKWSKFVKTGVLPRLVDDEPWPPYDPNRPMTVLVNVQGATRLIKAYRSEKCDFLKRYLFGKRTG